MELHLLVLFVFVTGAFGVQITSPSRPEVTVAVGENLDLRCEDERDDLKWVKDGMDVMEDSRHIISEAHATTSVNFLTIENVVLADAGNYQCKSLEDPIFGVADIRVNVEEGAEGPRAGIEILEPSGSESKAVLGQTFHIKCQSDILTYITWFKDELELRDESGGFLIQESEDASARTRISLLTKEDAALEDSAIYRCVNSDDENDSDSIDVTVSEEDEGEAEGEATEEAEGEEDGEDGGDGQSEGEGEAGSEGEGEGEGEDDESAAGQSLASIITVSLVVLIPVLLTRN